jgi:hypothetical protein
MITIKLITAKGTYSFSDEGTPQWAQHSDYEAQGDGPPQIRKTTYTIVQNFNEQAYSDNEARIQRLRAALDAGEGKLIINDERGGPLVSAQVRVRTDDVPRAWRQYVAEVTIVLEARRVLESAGALPAVFTPTGGTQVILPNLSNFKVGIAVTRFSPQAANRDEATETITASGFLLVDSSLPQAERLAFLQTKLAEFRRCNSKDGVLQWGAEKHTVKVQSLDADLGDGRDRINWSLVAFRKSFPAGTYVQPEYTVSQKNDYEAGNLVISVRGRVKADTETDAKNAIAELKQSYAGEGRTLENDEVSDSRVGGIDGAAWLEVSFGFDYREPISEFTSYQLRVSTKEEAQSADKTITYEGRVTGTSASVALAMARSLGFNKLPAMTSSNEVVSTKKNSLAESETFVEVSFSYDYVSKSALRFAEVNREVQTAPFGDPRETISGFVAAETLAAAQTMANGFKLSGRILRDSTMRTSERTIGEVKQAMRVDFSFTYYFTQVTVSIAYGVETTSDFTTLEKTLVTSGVARGPSEEACNSAIETLTKSTATGLKRVQKTRKADREKQTGDSVFISVSFTDRYIGPADDELGLDIVAASYSVRTQYSVNRASLTLIPFGLPFRQAGVGLTPGVQTITGTVTARKAETARAWGKSKQSLLHGGGDIDQIEDDFQPIFSPLSGDVVTKYTYNFTFAARYASLPYS